MATLKISDLPVIDTAEDFYSPVTNDNITKKFNFGDLERSIKTLIASCSVDEFSETKQYYINDFVLKDSKVYIFKSNHLGTWNSNDVNETTAMKEIKIARSKENTQTTKVQVLSDDSNFSKSGITITANTGEYIYTKTTLSDGLVSFDIPINSITLLTADDKTGYKCIGSGIYFDALIDTKTIYIYYKKLYSLKNLTISYNIITDSEPNDIDLDRELGGKELLVFAQNGLGTFFTTPIVVSESNINSYLEFEDKNNPGGTIYFPQINNYDISLSSSDRRLDFLSTDSTLNVTYTRDKHDREVQYLQSTGGQLIDTGLPGNTPNIGIEIKLKYSSEYNSATDLYVFGNFIDTAHNATRLMIRNGTSNNKAYGSANIDTGATGTSFNSGANGVPANTENIITLERNSTVGFSVNGVLKTGFMSNASGESNSTNIALFGSNVNTPLTNTKIGLTIYYFNIYQYSNGTKIYLRQFVPYSTIVGVGCFYDKANNKFYYNRGTGSFITGPNV